MTKLGEKLYDEEKKNEIISVGNIDADGRIKYNAGCDFSCT